MTTQASKKAWKTMRCKKALREMLDHLKGMGMVLDWTDVTVRDGWLMATVLLDNDKEYYFGIKEAE